jgi:MFS transporter, OPA family, glycerol-3-phosphate transporter
LAPVASFSKPAAWSASRIEPPARRRYRWFRIQTFSLTWLAYALLYFTRKNYSVVKSTMADELHLTGSQLGAIDTGFLVAYALGQFVHGVVGDRIGGRLLVGLGLMASALLNMLFGTGETLLFFLAGWTVNGFAQATGWPGCAKSFSQWFARPERGTVMGLWSTCYQVGAVLSTLFATWLLVHYGWRSAFFGPALLVAGFALVFYALQKHSPEREDLPNVEAYYALVSRRESPVVGREVHEAVRPGPLLVPDGGESVPSGQPLRSEDAEANGARHLEEANQEKTVEAGSSVQPDRDEGGGIREDVLYVVRSRVIWTLGLTYITLKFIRYTLWFWLPFYMSRQLGYSAGEAGYTAVAFDLTGIAGAVFAGAVSDRVFRSRRAPIVVIMMVLLAAATYGYSAMSHMGRLENLIGIALMGFLLYGPDSVTAGVAAVDFGRERAAALAAGFINGLGSIGAALSGVLVGRLSEVYGWESVFSLFTPLCLAGALLMATMWRKTAGP